MAQKLTKCSTKLVHQTPSQPGYMKEMPFLQTWLIMGTFDAVNGELIALDDDYCRIDAYGIALPVDPEMKSPFAVVANF